MRSPSCAVTSSSSRAGTSPSPTSSPQRRREKVEDLLALVFRNGRARVDSVAKPRQAGRLARVRVLLSGICNTDLELLRGYHGFSGIPGHEFVGVVEAPGTSPLLGKRVVGEINLACHACSWCEAGLERHCPK